MARITVEDCLQYVDNRFELVLLATKRARQLSFGTVEPLVPWEHDKPTVVALREIATGQISEEFIKACRGFALLFLSRYQVSENLILKTGYSARAVHRTRSRAHFERDLAQNQSCCSHYFQVPFVFKPW